MRMRLPSLFPLLIAFGSLLEAQTPRSYSIQQVFVTYLEQPSHTWADPATRGPALTAQDNAFWHGNATFGLITLTDAGTSQWVDLTISSSAFGPACRNVLSAVAAKLPPMTSTFRSIVMPPGTPCNSITSGSYFLTMNGSFIEHETGHALGLSHSFEQHCQTTSAGQCASQEYGHYSIMGTFTGISPYEREQLNVFSTTYQMPTLTATQDVMLQLSNTNTAGVKSLKVPALLNTQICGGTPPSCFPTVENRTLYLEYRDGDYVSKGVILWTMLERPDILIDQDRVTSALQWVLPLGGTYCDPANLWCVTLTAQTPTTATVHLAIGGSTGHAPSKISALSVTQ